MMADDTSLQCLLRFSVIILVTYFNSTSVKNGMGVTALLVVSVNLDYLWNITDQEWSWNITGQESLNSSLTKLVIGPAVGVLHTLPEWSSPLQTITDQESSDLFLAPSENNDNPLCFAYTDIITSDILFLGSLNQTCSLQVIAQPGTRIQLLQIPVRNVSKEPAFFYIERYGNFEHCMNKYVVFNEQKEPCSAMLMHQSVLITMQASVILYISQVPAIGNVSKCIEEIDDVQGNNNFSQISACSNVKGYNDTITCDPQITDRCKIRFPPNCGTIFGHREVVYKACYDLSQTYSAMMIYPVHTQVLHLSDNNMTKIEVDAFQSLINLEYLDLHNNKLRELDADLFLQLSSLKRLWIYHNMLRRLPPNIFRNLINLEILDISSNELSELNAELFLHLNLLRELTLGYNLLQTLSPNIFHNLITLEILILSNNRLSILPDEILQDLPNLLHLELSWNHLTEMSTDLGHLGYNETVPFTTGLFHDLKSLQSLQLDNNNLVKLPTGILSELIDLKAFLGNSNQIQMIEANAFQGQWNLIYLQLSKNNLTHLDHGLFKDTVSLAFLDLSHNQLKTIPTIQHLIHLNFFDLTNNPLIWISHDSFSSKSNTLNVFANQQEVCECYVLSNVNCSAADDRSPYLTCDRLLSTEALVVVMWLLGINALGGNLFVLLWRLKGSLTNKTNSMRQQRACTCTTNSMLLQNLAASDLVMGIYMLIIASADLYYGDNFPMLSENWRSGITCRIAGAMSITSSEASVFFVTLISIDRFISIRFPFSTRKLGKMTARVVIMLTWMIAVALGTVPSILSGSSFKFYDNSHVCIGLPLALTKNYTVESHETRLLIEFGDQSTTDYVDVFTTHENSLVNGQFFSTAVFLGLNCVCYLIILGCYIQIVRDVRKSSKRAGRS